MALNINGTTGISGVDGSVSAPAVTGTDSNTGITFPSADTIKFSTGGVERISITNSGISGTGIGVGITHASIWNLSSNFTGTLNPVTNFSAYGSANVGILGAAMTVNSGVFTFPTTGIWWIAVDTGYNIDGDSRYNRTQISTTVNNGSSYQAATSPYSFIDDAGYSGAGYSGMHTNHLFDVVDTSTHKCRFAVEVQNSGTQTYLMRILFVRYGDT